MGKICSSFCLAVVCLFTLASVAQSDGPIPILANPNRVSAGKLEAGTLTIHLEMVNGVWHPEADDGPRLFVQAFREADHPAQIPGPLLRIPQGTTVHVTIANKLKVKATVHGFDTRPGDDQDAFDIPPGETRERTFLAGAPGTYFYWAGTMPPRSVGALQPRQPMFEDAQLNGAFIVDPPGAVPPDRVFVIDAMFVRPDVVQEGFEVVAINGKSYPYTEPLEYTVGDHIRWRVINPSFGEHPMHLHGAFYQILSQGNFEKDVQYAAHDRQSVVTDAVKPAGTLMMEWSPEHAGRWLFHCHFHAHMSVDERLPVFTHVFPSVYDPNEPVISHEAHAGVGGAMNGMHDMAGLVLTINVKAAPGMPATAASAAKPEKIDLIIEPNKEAAASEPRFSCQIRENHKVVVSEDRAVGPPMFVTRGQPTEVTVSNHLTTPTTIHWHGLELESYYDGVVGAGVGDQVTPAIPPGGTFVARFTPTRAGTFIYHTHAADPGQLSGGIYGALIVVEPGQSFDADHDKLLVIGSRDIDFDAKRITINGMEHPKPIVLERGVTYRMRLINMAPNLPANFLLGSKDHPATWQAVAKDGADVPARLAVPSKAFFHIASGETYDFSFRPETTGEVPLEITNVVTNAKLQTSVIVR